MPKIFEWLGSLMFLVALIEFIPNPRKALESIPAVLEANPKIINGHLVMPKSKTAKAKHSSEWRGQSKTGPFRVMCGTDQRK